MNYPVWDVPIIGNGWVIGIIAIIHVLISHFAIGGGFYLPIAERKALKENRPDWLEHIKGHSKFFLILTAVFGAMTGVGIWFSIGLANPEGTSTLIHNFVFAWAIEYTFFLTEICAAAVYYYTWGRVSDRTHLTIGWIYAGTAWMSLFVINGILTFMLTPGAAWLSVAGTGNEHTMFWSAFFNPNFWPSLLLRTVICLNLAGLWAFVTASQINAETHGELKTQIMRWSVKWLIPGFVLLPFLFAWYVWSIPDSRLQLLQLGISTIGTGAFTMVTRMTLVTVMSSATIIAIAYFFAWRFPKEFKLGHAVALLLLGLTATAATEYSREMLRKPFVVVDHLYSNGMRTHQAEKFNAEGYLKHTPWVSPESRAQWEMLDQLAAQEAQQVTPEGATEGATEGAANPGPLTQALATDAGLYAANLHRGEMMFRGQCMACHTVNGYRSMRNLLGERDRQAIGNILNMLHLYEENNPYNLYMPPLVGFEQEIRALGDYLDALNRRKDAGTAAEVVEMERIARAAR
jgi:mono/diheme cytochrome c family protein